MLNLLNDNNYSKHDYEMALEYLYSLLEKSDMTAEFRQLCLADIEEVEQILKIESVFEPSNKRTNVRNKRARNRKKHQKLNKLYKDTSHSYPPAVIQDEDGSLRRFYCSQGAKKYFKKYSNKKLRRYSNKELQILGAQTAMKGNAYRKVFDYWWTLY